MRRKEDLPITKHTLNLYAGEYAALQELYPRHGAGKIIRTLVHRHLREALEAGRGVNVVPLDLSEILDDSPTVTEL